MRFPAAEPRPAQMVRAGAVDAAAWGDHAGLPAGGGDHGLEGRAGRVHRADGPVNQGMRGVLVERLPMRRRDSGREVAGIISRGRRQRQHRAGARINRDRRADPVIFPQHPLGGGLGRGIYRELDRSPRRGVLGIERPHRSPVRVNLNVRPAGPPMQVALVGRLHSGFAEKVVFGINQSAVVILAAAERVPFFGVDPPHRSEQVRGERAVRIPADGVRLGGNTRQVRLVFFNLRHRRHRHIERDA